MSNIGPSRKNIYHIFNDVERFNVETAAEVDLVALTFLVKVFVRHSFKSEKWGLRVHYASGSKTSLEVA